jgi:hypothetical protein
VPTLLQCFLAEHDEVVTRYDLIGLLGADGAQRATRRLVRLHPRTYTDRAHADDLAVRRRAALRWAGSGAALSHLSALALWRLAPDEPCVHVTTDAGRRLRSRPGVEVHRRAAFSGAGPYAVVRDGLVVVRVERAVVESWPLLQPGDVRRAPAILAVQRRLTTAHRIVEAAYAVGNLPGHAELLDLLALLAKGRHSPLEIWGHKHVFDHPSLPPPSPQLTVKVGGRTYHLDNPYPAERVDVELDGSAYHGPEQREADLRRDAALATVGWLTIRFTGRRLHAEPDVCRGETLAVLQSRRPQAEDRDMPRHALTAHVMVYCW